MRHADEPAPMSEHASSDGPMPPPLTPLARIVATIDAALEVGAVPDGHRRVIPISGGTVEGDRLRGEVVPGGADWNTVRPDGVMHFWARYTLRTHDGVLIGVINEAHLPDGVATITRAAAGGEPWRAICHPRFEAPEGPYAWLNGVTCIGTVGAGPTPASVAIDVAVAG
jgi:hypothetical protein